jgi:hypothetical protein
MQPKKKLKKLPLFFVILSFIAAFGCVVWLLIMSDDSPELINSSIGASAFFFLTSGFVVYTMARTNLPTFKFSDKDD